jgi:hypothetical protein
VSRYDPDPAEMAVRYVAEGWCSIGASGLVCSWLRQPADRDGGEWDEAAPRVNRTPTPPLGQPLGWGRNAHDAEAVIVPR